MDARAWTGDDFNPVLHSLKSDPGPLEARTERFDVLLERLRTVGSHFLSRFPGEPVQYFIDDPAPRLKGD